MVRNFFILFFVLTVSCTDKPKEKQDHIIKPCLERIVVWAKNLPKDALILKSYKKIEDITDKNKDKIISQLIENIYDLEVKPAEDSVFNDFTQIKIKKINDIKFKNGSRKALEKNMLKGELFELYWKYNDLKYRTLCVIDEGEVQIDPFLFGLSRLNRSSIDKKKFLLSGNCEDVSEFTYIDGSTLVHDTYGPDRGFVQIITKVFYDVLILNKDTKKEQIITTVRDHLTFTCNEFQGDCKGDVTFDEELLDDDNTLNNNQFDLKVNYTMRIGILDKSQKMDTILFKIKPKFESFSGSEGVYSVFKYAIQKHAEEIYNR